MDWSTILGYIGAVTMLIGIISWFIPPTRIPLSTKILILLLGFILVLFAIIHDYHLGKDPSSGVDTLPPEQTHGSLATMDTGNNDLDMDKQTPAPTPTQVITQAPTTTPYQVSSPVQTTTTPVFDENTPTASIFITPLATQTPEHQLDMAQPQIRASINKGSTYTDVGLYLNDDIGERMTFTCRSILVPDKSWDEELSEAELKRIATKWVDVIIELPNGMDAVIFCGGVKQDKKSFTEGVLVKLEEAGTYTFSVLNGEIVIWYNDQESNEQVDLLRILNQVSYGNGDTHRKLKLQVISPNLLSSIPSGFVNLDAIKSTDIPHAN